MKFMYKYWTLHQPTPHEKDHIQKPVATKLRPKPVLRQQLDHIYSNHLPRFSYRPYFHHRYRAVNAKPLSTLIPLKQKHFLHPTLNTNNNNGLEQANSTEECRERKRKYHPYEESFAYIIEYKADFPHTLSLSLTLSISSTHTFPLMLKLFHVWSVAYHVLVRISSFASIRILISQAIIKYSPSGSRPRATLQHTSYPCT